MGKYKILETRSADTWWGTRQVIDLQRDIYERLIIQVNLGSLTGGTTPAYITNASLYAINDITVETEGHVLTAIPQALHELQKLETGTVPQVSNTTANIEFWFTRSAKDFDYGVDFRKKNHLSVAFNFRTLGSITTGNPTGTSGSVVKIIGVVAPIGIATMYGFMTNRTNQLSANTEYPKAIEFKDSDKMFEKILLYTTTDATQMTASSSVISWYTVRRGNFDMIYDHLPFDVSQAMDKKTYGVENVSTGVTVVDDLGVVPASGSELYFDVMTSSASGYITTLSKYAKPL